jgi:Zn-finger nucleic acid-binding protein
VPLGTPDPRTSDPCPGCTALVANGSAFCPRCGAVQGAFEGPTTDATFPCPGCAQSMGVWAIAPELQAAVATGYRGSEAQIHGCRGCGGAWVGRRTLDEMIARARASGSVDPNSVERRTMSISAVVVYRTCPRCSQQMHRRNFARYSGIVVDECRTCGTYFDAGELEGVFAFVRSGGLSLSERRDAEETKRERAARIPAATSSSPMQLHAFSNPAQSELDVLVWFLRWVGRWLRRVGN